MIKYPCIKQYIVVSLAEPSGTLFFQPSEMIGSKGYIILKNEKEAGIRYHGEKSYKIIKSRFLDMLNTGVRVPVNWKKSNNGLWSRADGAITIKIL